MSCGRMLREGPSDEGLIMQFQLHSRNYEVGIKPKVFQLRSSNNEVDSYFRDIKFYYGAY